MITKRLVPIEAYSDEQGPVCMGHGEHCRYYCQDYCRAGVSPLIVWCNAPGSPKQGQPLVGGRPGPWCPVWYGESRPADERPGPLVIEVRIKNGEICWEAKP